MDNIMDILHIIHHIESIARALAISEIAIIFVKTNRWNEAFDDNETSGG